MQNAVLGAVIGYTSLWLVFWGFKLLTGKDGMGYGDFKLLAALGAWLGWQALPQLLMIAAVIGLLYALYRVLAGKQTISLTPFPSARFWPSLDGWDFFFSQQRSGLCDCLIAFLNSLNKRAITLCW